MLKSITSPASASRSKRRRSANPFRFCDHHVVHHKRRTRLLREIGKSLEKETSMAYRLRRMLESETTSLPVA